MKRALAFAASIAALFLFQRAASEIASRIAGLVDYSAFDPNGVFANLSVHHVLQALIALAAMLAFRKLDFRLKPRYSKAGFIELGVMCAVVLACVLVVYGAGMITAAAHPLTSRNITGFMAFQLLLSGPSEEILFRALPITLLSRLVNTEKSKAAPILVSVAAAALFCVAHINISLSPFAASYNPMQLAVSFLLGIWFGISYFRTKSVVYPMLMHSLSNVVIVGVNYIFLLA